MELADALVSNGLVAVLAVVLGFYLKGRFEQIDRRHQELRAEIREDFARLRGEFRDDISGLRSDLTQIALAVGVKGPTRRRSR